MMNTVRDDLSSGKRQASITSGSFGEGLEMRGGDLDIMIVWKEIEVCGDTSILLNPNKSYFAMETDFTQPGFTQLRLLHSSHYNIFQLCDERGANFYFSNTAFKQMVSTKNFAIVHGPCLSDKEGIFDLAVCCQSKSWIAPAMQWITRSNNGWPGIDVKQSIVQHGLWKLLRIDSVLFSEYSTLLPDDLKIKLESNPCSIPPLVYAHFLRFLCHFHLNNVRKCRDSLEDLKLTTDEEYFIANPEDKAFAYCILGIAFELSGDIESAKQAFVQSWRL
ncbi:unnamed protein product [Mytilus coruscus]|uniref:Mab-21-like HhH/H2TH-like domain-containing protein n=1 Tax=Mytilus coruscus TaxID=42192 RepID=A0A6J8C8A0_MYTCO|nr:unnamed protein product [Mytilus coruscus]